MDTLYSRATQRQTIAGILGSQELADYYIHATNDYYLARGHLAAKVDFLFGNQQRATFYFLNTAPQWQRFNAQNWEALEDSSKKFASDRGYDLDVWTGTHGVMGLKDASGTPREIWLYVNGATKQIPVPKIYYRVMVHKSDRRGIVLIGVNNPYLTLDEIKKDYTFCTDVSSQVNYITWQKDDVSKGYSYACEVQDFLKSVPHFTVSTSGLLL